MEGNETKRVSGYGFGSVKTVLSVDEVEKQSKELDTASLTVETLDSLAGNNPIVIIDDLHAQYGQLQILRGINLRVGRGQSLCLIGPNGAGKSTLLHSIYGFTKIVQGSILVNGQNVTHLPSNEKLKSTHIAYVLQDSSVFHNMTVEENLLMGGYLLQNMRQAKEQTDKVFAKYERLKPKRTQLAGTLSGGERRLLEISRALIMDPEILLIDEPSIGLEPRYIDMVFEILQDLKKNEGKTIIMVEQNAKKGLENADVGYVLVNGRVVLAGSGNELLENENIGKLFLGG